MRKKQFGLTGTKLKRFLQEQENYMAVVLIPYIGWSVIEICIDHTALKYCCDQFGCKGHYRFKEFDSALLALLSWNGVGDPEGPWFEKHYMIDGQRYHYENPEYQKYVEAGVEFISDKLWKK